MKYAPSSGDDTSRMGTAPGTDWATALLSPTGIPPGASPLTPGRERPEVADRSLANEFREAILGSRFADGERLPTEAEISRERGLSRQTVRRAFQDLVNEGLVNRVPGRGTFARKPDSRYLRQFGSIEELMGFSLDTDFELLLPLHVIADSDAATKLGLAEDRLMSAAFRRIHDGIPFCFARVFLPPDIGTLLRESPEVSEMGVIRRATIVGLLDRVCEAPVTEAEQVITVAELPADIAHHLNVAPGTPALQTFRTYFDSTGRPVEHAISHFLPEHYSYRVRLYRAPTTKNAR